MEKKQSSVEWLIKQAENLMPPDVPNGWVKIKEQAKAMHKDEIETAYKSERYPCSDWDAQDYYNQTFGE